MWKYYKLADLAVFPSIWEEPAGLTMLEATIASLPLITTRTGGIVEYLEEEQAIFVDNDEKIVNALTKKINDFFDNEKKYNKKMLCISKKLEKE